jgi:hypothetical protein
MTEAERIDFLIKTLESGNAKTFGQKIGASESAMSRMRSGKYGIRKKINAILLAYPAVNRDWLETGEGYPGDLTIDLVRSYYDAKLARAEAIIDLLIKRIELGEEEK